MIGHKKVNLTSCHSTNDIATEMLKQSKVEHGTVIFTDEQTNGRGQRGNNWYTEKNKNVLASIILDPSFEIDKVFYLNIVTSLAIKKWLSRYVKSIFIKWPNDIYISEEKIGGILIENQLQGKGLKSSVVGVGVNINQKSFGDLGRATSLCLQMGKEVDLEGEKDQFLKCFNHFYQKLSNGELELLKKEYLNSLLFYHEKRRYEDNSGAFIGTIIGVTGHGCLKVLKEKSGITVEYDFKAIRFLF